MNRDKAKQVAAAVEQAVAETLKGFGLVPEPVRTRYGDAGLTLTIDANETDSSGEPMTREREALELVHPGLYGTEYTVRGERCKLIGYNPKAPKYPAIFEKGGNRYKGTPDHIKAAKRARDNAQCAAANG